MSCKRAKEIDLGEFLLEREEPRWKEFRNHYPGCDDCSREVASLSNFERVLRSASVADSHPSEEALLGLTTLSLASSECAAVEQHLEGCSACRSEVAVLRSFDFSAVQSVSVAEVIRPNFFRKSVVSLAEWRDSLSWASVQPALVAAALVLIAVPIGLQLWQQGEVSGSRPSQDVEIAQEAVPVTEAIPSVPSVPDRPTIPAMPTEPIEEPIQLAEGAENLAPDLELAATPVNPVAEEIDLSSGLDEDLSDAVELAAAPAEISRRVEDPTSIPEASEKAGLVLAEGETMLIAALLPGDLPVYGVQGLMGLSGPSVRTGGYVRSVGTSGAAVEVLSPEHMGRTSRATPTLYWRLSEATDLPLEIVISDDVSVEPLLETRLTGPRVAGIHGLSLALEGVELSPNITYRWSVALVVDDAHRSRDRFASSALLYRPPGARATGEFASAEAGHLAHRYAAQGYWYDAFDQLTLWLEAEPGDARLLEHRAALLEQVGLEAEPASE
jgi:hypothetical protein